MMTNCPNCGAPIIADRCEYCGTLFSTHDVIAQHSTVERLLASGVVSANEARELCGLSRTAADVPEWHSPISPVDAYKKGEIVNYCGVLRRSIINNNVYPPVYDGAWQTV